MDDHDDPNQIKIHLVQTWHEYGARFGVFVPQEHPAPTTWELDVPEHDAKGRVNPHYVKHWKFFAQTKAFVRERYANHHILEGPGLAFDCLVRKFQPRIFYKSYQDEHGNPVFYEVNDRYEWYERAIRMSIFEWQVGFVCRSNLCERDWCILHRRNPRKIVPVDIYSFVATFEDISVAVAKTHVGKAFGMKLGDLESKGVRLSTRLRRKVPKKAILAVLVRYKKVRTQHVTGLIDTLTSVIQRSELVEWHRRMFDEEHAFMNDRAADNLYKIKSPAVKAYVWLLIRQEELARNTRGPKLEVSDMELARAIGVSKPSAQTYRKALAELRLIEAKEVTLGKATEIRIVKVKY